MNIFWFKQDLRISDNPGLATAVQHGSIMPIFIWDPAHAAKIGAASKWWLYYSLKSLDESLGHKLNIYLGDSITVFNKIIKHHKIKRVFCNNNADKKIIDFLTEYNTEHNIEYHNFNAELLWEPQAIVKKDGSPYKVYTPFYHNGCLNAQPPRQVLAKLKKINLVQDLNNKTTLEDLKLLPKKHSWHEKLTPYWQIGELAAHKKLQYFIKHNLAGYQAKRNFPALNSTSKLSPHLHFGEISPNQIWYAALAAAHKNKIPEHDIECFLSELGWREFANNLLHHFPQLPEKNFQKKFDNFPWRSNKKLLTAWQQGKTGYPIIDAGMRELWQTGYMHNRVRMIVASFLVKNLLIHWHYGRDWFWDCLVDADIANNSINWQWVAGCGVDAAPYIRIFNPTLQGEKFDANGDYTRRWVPELAKMPNKFLFKPFEAPPEILKEACVILGKNYPKPIVDFKISRQQALSAYR